MAAGYLEILRARHAARLLAGTLVGRLPNATAAIAIVLFVRARGRHATAWPGRWRPCTGSPTPWGSRCWGGWWTCTGSRGCSCRRRSSRRSAMARLRRSSGTDPLPVAYAAVAVAGLFTPPLEGGLRALWPSVLRREDQVHTAYAMDAVAQEVMFTVGPLLVTLCVSLWSARAALLVLNVDRGAGRPVGGRLAALARVAFGAA